MNTKFDANWVVLIGRFSPAHNPHISLVREALKHGKQVVVCIGSCNGPRTIKNPWTGAEREQMIRSVLDDAENARVYFQYIEDRLYNNDQWATLVRGAVRSTILEYYAGNANTAVVKLLAAAKDDTSWYFNLFPEWPKIKVNVNTDDDEPVGATKVRELLFTGHKSFIRHVVPEPVYTLISEFTKTPEFAALKEEFDSGMKYERLYENHPDGHSINFYTADSVVLQSGHILLVKRKKAPGKGLWALPGGHINPNESADEASLRELDEETGIKVPKKVLVASLVEEKLFDHPDRSMRARITKKNARTVDMAFCYKLNDVSDGLPKVKGADDAEIAWWFTFEEFAKMRDQMFEDHHDIGNYFISKYS